MNVQNSLCPPTQNFQMHFRKPHEEFLGIIISQRRVEMDPKKLNTIQSRSSPTSVKTIWSFTVWLISTKSWNLTSPPLLRLSTFWPERMNSPWIWTQLQQNAFETLKHIKFFLCPNTPNPSRLLPLYNTDTSLLAAGTVLMQSEINGNLHSYAYFSKMFTPAERNYDSYDQELLAIILALIKWRQYLRSTSHPVTIITHHKNLS